MFGALSLRHLGMKMLTGQQGLFHVLARKIFVVTSMDYVYEIWNFT
ncbi:hypothetical protein [Pseudanabaena sp. PCC 6802]|nr:hypothetical protein [Pseudanabaena sp. PCC 6802]